MQRRLAGMVKYSLQLEEAATTYSASRYPHCQLPTRFLASTQHRDQQKPRGGLLSFDLQVKHMSKWAKGTVEEPGEADSGRKTGLNKAILDQGWGMFRGMLEYKQMSGVQSRRILWP